MNEEYIKKVFDSLNLDESHYEAFKKDISTNEDYNKKVFSSLNLDESHYEAFKKDTGFYTEPEDPKGVETETENTDLESSSVSVKSRYSLDSKSDGKIDLKNKLEEGKMSKKDISSPLMKERKFETLEQAENNEQVLKSHLENEKKNYLDNLPDKGFDYKEKAAKKLTEEYTDAYKHSNVSWNITDDQIAREAIKMRKSDLDDELYEKTDMVKQSWDKFKSGGLRALSGLSGLPNYFNKTLFTLMASDEQLEQINSLTPEQRENVLNSLEMVSPVQSILGKLSSQSQNYLKNKNDELQKEIVQFHNSIGEDFTNLNFTKAFSRIGTEGAQQIPMLAQTMIPYVGLASVALGEVSNKQEELEDEGYGLGLDTTINATLNGVIIGISEAFTKKLGSKAFKAFTASDDVARQSMLTSMKKMFADGTKEGLTEVGEETFIKLSDALIQGKEGQFNDYWKEMMDVYIIGKAVGTTISGSPKIVQQTNNLIEEYKTNTLISSKENNYGDLSDVFKGKTNLDKLKLADYRSTNVRLDKVLEKKVSNGDITQKESDEIKTNFLETKEAITLLNQSKKIKINDVNKAEAVDLLIEKKKLKEEMKNADDAFHPEYKEKIEKINERIREKTSAKNIESEKDNSRTKKEIIDKKNETEDTKKVNKLFNDPNPETKVISDKYKKKKGLNYPDFTPEFNRETSKEIADAYDEMKHDPYNPEVREAYQAMADETVEQYNEIIDAGYEAEMYQGEGEPYANSGEMIKDLKDNKHLYIFSTEVGLGNRPITETDRKENIMLNDSGFKDKKGNPLLLNDMFRFVHDFFGHSEKGNSFGVKGEEIAWDNHARMYSDKARRAMTTETRGQNSWVNSGKHLRNADGSVKKKGDEGYLSVRERPYAEQKIGLLPEKYSQVLTNESNKKTNTVEQKSVEETTDTSNDGNVQPDKDAFKKTADEIRKLKVNSSVKDAMSKLQSNPVGGVFTAAWDGAVETVAKTIEVTGDIVQAVDKAVEYLKTTDWYKSLSKEGKEQAIKKFKEEGFKDYQDNLTPEQAYKKSKSVADNARKQAVNKTNNTLVKKIKNKLSSMVDSYLDRQGSVKKAISKIGLEQVVDYMVTKSGASSLAKNKVETVYKKTFHNLSNEDIKNLEEIIQHLRTLSISKNRKSRGLEDVKRQGDVTPKEAELALEGYKQVLGDKKFNDLKERAENYFDEYRNLLKTMLDEGLINKEFYDNFVNVDYKPTQYLDFLEDMDGTFLESEADKNNNYPLSGKQIQTMTEGYTGNELMDAWGIMQKSILARTKAVFNNRVNKTFADEFTKLKKEIDKLREKENLTKEEKKRIEDFKKVEDNVKLDQVVGFTDGNNPKYKLEGKNTKGYKSLYYYKDGVKNRILLKEKFFDKFTDTNNQILQGAVRENVALVSGTSMVKSLATGNNPLFFLTNTPRDFLFTLTFSKEYGNEVISNGIKLARDMVKGVKDVTTNSKNYQKYLEYGGGMDYLALQGKYREKGWAKTMIDGVFSQKFQDKVTRNKFKRFMDKFNLASEVGIRLAVFNRSVKNQLKGKDINSLPKEERDLIYTKAVRSARELTDFNQGGKVTKAVDAGLPYLNAAVQGTRAAAINLKDRPVETLARITQVTAYSVGATISASLGMIGLMRDDDSDKTNSEIYFETIEGVSEYDLQNYFIIPTGTKDEQGNWKYMRIAKAQSLTPFLNSSEYFIRKQMSDKYKGDLGDIMSSTIKNNILPIDPNPLNSTRRVPLVDAGYAWFGYDSYTGNPLDWKKGKIPVELEGIVDDRVEPMFKKIGEQAGVSPIRLQESIESFVTTPSTNPYVGIVYSLGNLTTFALSKDDTELVLPDAKKQLLEPAMRRLIKSTSDYNKVAKLKNEISDEIVDIHRKHIKLEKKVRTAVKDLKLGNGNPKEVVDRLLEEYPDDKKRIASWIKSEYKKKDNVSYLTNSLKFMENKEVRAAMLFERFGLNMLNVKELGEPDKKLLYELKQNGVLDGETVLYYKQLTNK